MVGLDFDGTLVADRGRSRAGPHPPGRERVLADLAEQVRAVAVITGRPARQALDLGGLEEVGNAVGENGRELFVLGQYGNERWTSTNRRVISPTPPRGLASFTANCRGCSAGPAPRTPGWRRRGWPSPFTRGDSTTRRRRTSACCRCSPRRRGDTTSTSSPVGTWSRSGPTAWTRARPCTAWSTSSGRKAIAFLGDDLGDLEAFNAVDELRARGFHGLLVASRSEEENALAERADLVVDGPEGVLDLLREMTDQIRSARA